MQSLALEEDVHLGLSARSVFARGEDPGQDQEQEFWVSTQMLVVLLSLHRNTCRSLSRRAELWESAKLWSEAVLDAEQCRHVKHWICTAEIIGKCDKRAGQENTAPCDCMVSLLGHALPTGNQHSAQFNSFLAVDHLLCCEAPPDEPCLAIRAWAAQKLDEMARQSFATATEQWGDTRWHEGPHGRASTTSRMRADPHVKQWVLQDAAANGVAQTLGEAAKHTQGFNTGIHKLRAQEMAAYRQTCRLSFFSSQSISCAVDGARVGKPAKELLWGHLSDDAAGRHCCLPPQVALTET